MATTHPRFSSTHVLNIVSNPAAAGRSNADRLLSTVLTILGLVFLSLSAQAQDSPAIEFDLVERQDSLAVLMDISSLLTSARITRLRDGINLGIECRLTLRRPRRLFGSVRLAERSAFCRLSYQLLTKGYHITVTGTGRTDSVAVSSLSRLHAYLTDSVIFSLIPLDSLDREPRYIVDLEVSAISLNSINLASGDDHPENDRSPLKLLFEQFLVLTDYGRETFSISSRPFSRAELSSR